MGKVKGKIRKKHESGAATNYISRKQALKKLQLSLKDFRRLCILKGVYPHEPLHKKKVNKGSTEIKTWYYIKDINFLAHEPIIQKFRQYRVFLRKLRRAKEKDEKEAVERLYANKPRYKLDHVVKERYPNFVDAIRDLDDALCLCFLFSRMPNSSVIKPQVVQDCRRLTVEFLHCVIAGQCLRKVFVSIKGVYYQAEIMGEKVTWIVPHERMQPEVTEVDFSVMATFLEFYRTMLGSVNCRLYSLLGLYYPPKLDSRDGGPTSSDKELYEEDPDAPKERIYSLGQKLERLTDANSLEEDVAMDVFPIEGDLDEIERARKEQERVINLQKLFRGKKFFLNREVPRESLVFVIRSCGGEVSWDASAFYGSTYQESDEGITHQIVDRPSLKKQNINRLYMQPQWVYDSVNCGKILAAKDYYLGCELPPHLSPFVQEEAGDYVPPERIEQLSQAGEDVSHLIENESEDTKEGSAKKIKKNKIEHADDTAEGKKMSVEAGRMFQKNKQKEMNEAGEEERLRELMIAKKHKRVYHKIKRGIKRKAREVKAMKEKRKKVESA